MQPESSAAENSQASEPCETQSAHAEQPASDPVQNPVQPTYQQPYQQPYQHAGQSSPPPFLTNTADSGKNGLAIASMILGIVSIVFGCCTLLSIPCAIVGIVLGILGIKSEKRGIAIAGIVLSGIGIIASVLILVLSMAVGQSGYLDRIWSDFGDMDYYYYQ